MENLKRIIRPWYSKENLGKKTKKWFESVWSVPDGKYEKIEFDMNTIDVLLWKQTFQGMEFIFDHIDTSRVTEKLFIL
jgi:hypothetical protein